MRTFYKVKYEILNSDTEFEFSYYFGAFEAAKEKINSRKNKAIIAYVLATKIETSIYDIKIHSVEQVKLEEDLEQIPTIYFEDMAAENAKEHRFFRVVVNYQTKDKKTVGEEEHLLETSEGEYLNKKELIDFLKEYYKTKKLDIEGLVFITIEEISFVDFCIYNANFKD